MNKVSDFEWRKTPDYEILQGISYKEGAVKTKLVETPDDLRARIRTLKKPSDFIASKGYRRCFYYRPLVQYPELFLEFKDLNIDSHEEIIGFAKKYGVLGGELNFNFSVHRGKGKQNLGDSLSFWAWEQTWLKIAFSLWSYLRTDQEEYIPGQFVTKKNVLIKFQPDYLKSISSKISELKILPTDIFVAGRNDTNFKEKKESEHQFLCKKLLEKILNVHLQNRFSFKTKISTPKEANIYFRPHSLIGAIWLQLALAVAELKDFQKCLECNKWIEVSSERKRKDVKYCSNACRVKAYRKRKKDKQS